jgi:hypothetical protein
MARSHAGERRPQPRDGEQGPERVSMQGVLLGPKIPMREEEKKEKKRTDKQTPSVTG